jgi:hypothetical protein
MAVNAKKTKNEKLAVFRAISGVKAMAMALRI